MLWFAAISAAMAHPCGDAVQLQQLAQQGWLSGDQRACLASALEDDEADAIAFLALSRDLSTKLARVDALLHPPKPKPAAPEEPGVPVWMPQPISFVNACRFGCAVAKPGRPAPQTPVARPGPKGSTAPRVNPPTR